MPAILRQLRQRYEWIGEDFSPRKQRFIKSEDHVVCVFNDNQRVLNKEFVKEGCTVNAQYFRTILERITSRIGRVHLALYQTLGFFLLLDNSPAHTATSNQEFLAQIQYKF